MFRTIFTTLRALLKSGLCATQLCIRSDTASYGCHHNIMSSGPASYFQNIDSSWLNCYIRQNDIRKVISSKKRECKENMLVWRNLVLEPNFDSFWFQTRLNRDFIFWSFICTMIDTQTQIRGLNKSNWLQNWEYSQIMLVWHLSLTQSQMLYLWKCDRPMSKVIFCILKQRTCRWKTQKRNHQQRMYCPQI